MYVCTHDAREHIRCVMECLVSVIDSCTEVPTGLDIKPSPSSLIAMSCQEGVLTDEKGKDFLCAGGKPVSSVLSGGVCYEPGSGEDKKLLEYLGEGPKDDGAEGVKRRSQMEWVRAINSIANRAEEIVKHEMIYT